MAVHGSHHIRARARGETGAPRYGRGARRYNHDPLGGAEWPQLDLGKKLIVVAAHRRVSFGDGFENICAALVEPAHPDDV
jgi:hypothetical protein